MDRNVVGMSLDANTETVLGQQDRKAVKRGEGMSVDAGGPTVEVANLAKADDHPFRHGSYSDGAALDLWGEKLVQFFAHFDQFFAAGGWKGRR